MELVNVCVREIADNTTNPIGINQKMIDNYSIKLSNVTENQFHHKAIRKRFNDLIFT